ncbi:MAG: polymer-forming cytoskeletal protein [Ruminiclostridium sp.]|nr:polymer-forming cytoskeletal protein [Ruminiclostridium sp.]
MGLKDNFSQAFRELTSPKEAKEQEKTEIKDVAAYMNDGNEAEEIKTVQEAEPVQEETQEAEAIPTPENTEEEQMAEQTQRFNNPGNTYGGNANAYGGAYNQATSPATTPAPFGNPQGIRQESSETTIISKNTIIDGNVRSFADMRIDGSIKGSVETTKNVSVNGKVVGNITCDNAVMNSASVQGNITLKGQATMSSESMLIGDLTSQVASVNGKMKGNLTVAGKAQLDRDAVVFGDIKAGAISISDGAIVQGYISTTYLSQDESSNIFPDSIAIGE